jgi:hypothetical protein
MMTRRGFAAVFLGCVALAVLGGCRAGESPSYRYKLAVEVETPVGARSSYSVIAVQFYGPMKGFEALSGGSVRVRGQAVVLDLPNGKTLFVLLGSDASPDWAGYAHRRQFPKSTGDFATPVEYSKALVSNTAVFPVRRWVEMPNGSKRDDYPLIVTFKDINDPTSVQRVDPDDFTASVGKGYWLKAITVQVADEPVTTGIETRLRWLLDKNRKRFDPENPPAGILLGNYRGLFSTEISKRH